LYFGALKLFLCFHIYNLLVKLAKLIQ